MLSTFKSIHDLLQAFPTEQDCIDHLEQLRWNGEPVSPFDQTSYVYKCKGTRYRCRNSKKYFNVKVGTIFEDTKIPLQKWFLALYIFSSNKKGISSHQLAKDISVTQKTAWFMLHRLRYAFDHSEFNSAMQGTVEVDETYVGGAEKNKHESKKTKGTQGRNTKAKKPVVGMVERDGILSAVVVGNTTRKTIEEVVGKKVNVGTTICTDEYQVLQWPIQTLQPFGSPAQRKPVRCRYDSHQ
jgi:transposase-like protein